MPKDRDEDTLEDRTQEIVPEDTDVLRPGRHDPDTAAEAAEQADPGATASVAADDDVEDDADGSPAVAVDDLVEGRSRPVR